MDRTPRDTLLARLGSNTSGNALGIAAASVFAIMGVVGGAVDISRSYMVQSRLQQACDAGALAARKSMSGDTLTADNKATGYRYFDFNFPAGSYGSTLTSRTYSQHVNQAGTPQAVVNGTVIASVPMTIMRVFGNERIDLTVKCSSKMDISNADVAMVLDITGSMDTNMKISSSGTATEDRILALHKAVKAFYDALGPGRAGGDLSKGRIRYAFIPYGITVNVSHLLNHNQMVDSWTYHSREAKLVEQWGWTTPGSETVGSYSNGSPMGAPLSAQTAALTWANYDTWSVPSGTGDVSYTKMDGTAGTALPRTVSATSSTCASKNDLVTGQTNFKAIGQRIITDPAPTETTSTPAPVYPETTRTRTYTNIRKVGSMGYRYTWDSGTATCKLVEDSGDSDTYWDQTRTKTGTWAVTWTPYHKYEVEYGPRVIDVSGLKNTGTGGWNYTLNVPNYETDGSTTAHSNIRLSGNTSTQTVYSGRTPDDADITWRGCIEERDMVNTITSATSIDTIPTGAYDLDVNLAATSSATKWRPWLARAAFYYDNDDYTGDNNPMASENDCPAPALALQEIGNYDTTVFTTPYPNLFRSTSGAPTSYYYPYSSTAALNAQTIKNYINRITADSCDTCTDGRLTGGTLHDIGFAWGLHLVSGEGMFAANNPDRFNGILVSRNIVFMTDGEMNPGEERYVFSGYNDKDGRLAPAGTGNTTMKGIENRRMRILCESAKRQGITVWVVAITDTSTSSSTYDDLRACASSSGHFKSAATSQELISSFTTIAQSIGGLRVST